MTILADLIKKIPGISLLGRSIHVILAQVNLKLIWDSSLTHLENELQSEKQKNETLVQELQTVKTELTDWHQLNEDLNRELDKAKAELNHDRELQELMASGQIINTSDFLTKTISRLGSVHLAQSLTAKDIKTLYNHTLQDAFLVLSSEIFETFALEFQVELIEKIFLALLNLRHSNANLVADLIADHYRRILGRGDLQDVMAFKIYQCLYGLYWCGASSLSEMQKFDLAGVRPLVKYITDRLSPSMQSSTPVLPNKQTLNICYFCHYADFAKGNAISPIIVSLAKAHDLLSNRRIFVYCVQWAIDEFAQTFAETEVVVRLLAQQSEYGSIDDIIAQIKADEIDVVITDVSSSIATYIFLHRAAPLQMWLELGCPYWNIPQVDWVFLCAKDYQHGFGVPARRCSSLTPSQEEITLSQPCSPSALDEAQALLPKGVKIFAVFTRLIKITPAYLDIVRRILDNCRSIHFLIVGTGDPRLIYDFIANEMEGRVTFLHYNVDLNVYGRVVDVFLDTFPFIGGNACREVAIHGKPVLSFYHLDFGRLLLDERDPDLIARSADEYVAIATRLATNLEFYRAKSQMAIHFAKKSTNVTETVTHIDEVIQRLLKKG